MTPTNDLIIQHTLNWIKSFIIEYNLCPFAKGPVNKGAVRIEVVNASKLRHALEALMLEVYFLDKHPAIETTLVVFSEGFKDFFSYLDMVSCAEELLMENGYEGV